MTNEEKAKEIGGLCDGCLDERKNLTCQFDCINKGLYYGALKMADWKENQFKLYLEKKKMEADKKMKDAYEDGEQWDYYMAEQNKQLINEIINELFKED